MAVLERVMQLQQSGVEESDIVKELRSEGVSPKEIYEALNQSKIKSELDRTEDPSVPEGMQESMKEYSPDAMSGMQQSTDPNVSYEEQPAEYAPPSPEEYVPDPNQASDGYQTYQQQPTDIETINDLAEQIVEEKNAKFKKDIEAINKFKENAEKDLEHLNQRLQKIENVFNELQVSILKKIGEYGENINNISKEMHANQDTFSKMLNPIINNKREQLKEPEKRAIPPITPTEQAQTQPKRALKNKDPGFEDYLR